MGAAVSSCHVFPCLPVIDLQCSTCSLCTSVSFLFLLPPPPLLLSVQLTSCRLVSLLLFCSTCPHRLHVSFNRTVLVNIFHITKPTFSSVSSFLSSFPFYFPFLSTLPPHSLTVFPFLPPSLLLILAACSLQQCSVWFDLSVCRAATPPCFYLTRADEACGHFTTAHFGSRAFFPESLCVPDHCLCYHTCTILLSLVISHNHIHADNGTSFIWYTAHCCFWLYCAAVGGRRYTYCIRLLCNISIYP